MPRHLDDLDREYYRSKIEELRRYLPVIKAAKAWYASTQTDGSYPTVALEKAVEALQSAENTTKGETT